VKKIYLFLIIILFPLLAFSAELDYELEKPQKLFVGTPFKLHVDISSAISDTIFSTQNDTLDIFILKDIVSTEEIINYTKTTLLDLTYQPFDTGKFTFPELEFAVKTADSLIILKTREFILNIESVIADSTESIKDIAAPLSVNLKFFDYFIPILLIIIIVFAIKYLIKFIKNSKKEVVTPEVVDDRPAYIIALELLNNLKKDDLIVKGDYLNFYFRISLILRLFIELHYEINSVEMTTSEIRANLILEDHSEKSKILKFLANADMIKFAKAIPAISDSEKTLFWLEDYLKSFGNLKETEESKNA
jgi:DNA integrity scanning protein DisA with diadenylate cyclase activity